MTDVSSVHRTPPTSYSSGGLTQRHQFLTAGHPDDQLLVWDRPSGSTNCVVITKRNFYPILERLNLQNITYQCSHMTIPSPGARQITVMERDLLEEQERWQRPGRGLAVAEVTVPRSALARGLVLGQFKELYILSVDDA